jgi:hypothetical protein
VDVESSTNVVVVVSVTVSVVVEVVNFTVCVATVLDTVTV